MDDGAKQHVNVSRVNTLENEFIDVWSGSACLRLCLFSFQVLIRDKRQSIFNLHLHIEQLLDLNVKRKTIDLNIQHKTIDLHIKHNKQIAVVMLIYGDLKILK